MINSRHKGKKKRQSGQIAVEYLVVLVAVLIVFSISSVGYRIYCNSNQNTQCQGLYYDLVGVLTNEVTVITGLLNLP